MSIGVASLFVIFMQLLSAPVVGSHHGPTGGVSRVAPSQGATRQLFAVRGEVIKIQTQSKGMLSITVKPAKEFGEVTVLARENDLVGRATGQGREVDLLGILAGDSSEDETITAAELTEGDIISVIYDPQLQNRAVEIYIR